ncbi:MBL fold metallo-hydrolase [uncultured Dokdonia sp.]|uniref:MBL fold metallo-hydrolase n=1 Tax=uncultured Dokdonia sp. TaxID=575653 RepID=UPI0026378C38|nr:MBL fold metallo-hydrolase [uncultured Dokdonia sp.]
MNLRFLIIPISLFILSCGDSHEDKQKTIPSQIEHEVYIKVLGIAQDGGMPHINNPSEFKDVATNVRTKELVVSLGLIDREQQKKYLFDATPDMPQQLHMLDEAISTNTIIDGVFLTHAHMGHYTGLMHFGREAMGSKTIPVYAMPKMKKFLETNGPWSQLVDLNNIMIHPIQGDRVITLSRKLKITPFLVPHRDEFSETVGYRIEGPEKTALFIPDINKWSVWETSIVEEVKKVDYAFIDATFFSEGEIPRPMSEVPHPFIDETTALFSEENKAIKSKVIFIHFNHSNPALYPKNSKRVALEEEGYRFAHQGAIFGL